MSLHRSPVTQQPPGSPIAAIMALSCAVGWSGGAGDRPVLGACWVGPAAVGYGARLLGGTQRPVGYLPRGVDAAPAAVAGSAGHGVIPRRAAAAGRGRAGGVRDSATRSAGGLRAPRLGAGGGGRCRPAATPARPDRRRPRVRWWR